MSLLPSIRPSREIKKITSFIKSTFKSANFTKAVIASSGGIDSSVTLALAVKALGKSRVFVLKLPYKKSYPQGAKHADLMAKRLKIPKRNVYEVNVGSSSNLIWKNILIKCSKSQTGLTQLINQIRLGNITARTRMIYLYDMAKARKALVVGTENRSEHLLGYYTRFGDEASDLEPLKHLYKTHVYQLARYLKLPQEIIDQPPTAGLWDDQTDKEELGFSYALADQVLYLRFDKKLTPSKIARKLKSQNSNKALARYKRLVKKVLDRVDSSSFKHDLPYHL